MMNVPASRVRSVNEASIRDGKYVLYWMIGSRRTASNFGLDRAAEWCEELRLPLVVFEPVSCRFPWSTVRFHHFLIGGMCDNRLACEQVGIRYCPMISRTPDADKGLLEEIAREASVVVTDDSLVATLATLVETGARRVSVRMEAVDSNGLLPFRTAGRAFATALSFRRYLQQRLLPELGDGPSHDALKRAAKFGRTEVSLTVQRRLSRGMEGFDELHGLPIDNLVGPEPRPGGRQAGLKRLRSFLRNHVQRYGQRGDLMDRTHSGLSPYLHFGHIGAHDVLLEITRIFGWRPPIVRPTAHGARNGWWGLPEPVETFLDELVTWRELSINGAAWIPSYKEYDSLPDWAVETLDLHVGDRRPWTYQLEILETGETHDPLWNAAQQQLLTEGHIHSYLRMLWGKKILEWSESPREALWRMVYLNDTYATDGRDPNSYSGIFWVLGRYDRPWMSRPVFGKVRYMTSENTARKFKTAAYMAKYLSHLD